MALGEYHGPSSYRAFVRYVVARQERELQTLEYRVYVTDMLRNIPQMKYINERWYDMTQPRHVDGRSAEEIADDLIARLSGGDE